VTDVAPLPRPTSVLAGLRVLRHVLFGVLVAVGWAQGWRSEIAGTWLAVAVAPMVLAYVVGARAAMSYVEGARAAPPYAVSPRRTPGLWLVVLGLAWLVAVLVSASFVWVGFALWLLAGQVLTLRWALGYTAVVLLAVILAPGLAGPGWTVAGVVGPTVGALFALGLSRGQVLLARDALERARLLDALMQAQAESAALQEQLALTQREVGAMSERTRLSRDIHDTVAQGFSSIVLLARGASVSPGEPDLRRLLARIEDTAADNLTEIRAVVAALAPSTLQHSGLAAALRRLLDDLHADTGLDTELRVAPELTELSTTHEVALLRTAQSALANIRSHARAARVVVSLDGSPHEVRLDVVDDGVGFDPAILDRPGADLTRGGYGVAATRARLTELGGGLIIESAPGEGTAVSAHLPLTNAGSSGAS